MPAPGAPAARRRKPARPTIRTATPTRFAIEFTVQRQRFSTFRWILTATVTAQIPILGKTFGMNSPGRPATCTGPYILRRNGDCLVANVVPESAGKLFTYYDADGHDLGAAPAAAAIKRVRVAFAVEVKNPDAKTGGSLEFRLSTSVEFRN